MLVLSSAGSPGSLAHKVWTQAETSSHWATSCTPGPSPWWSDEDIAATRADLTPSEWSKLILCEWVAGDDALTTLEDVIAVMGDYGVLEPQPGRRYNLALDIGVKRDRTVLAVGHLERAVGGRHVVVDRLIKWEGAKDNPVSLSDVEEAIVAMSSRYNRSTLHFDPYMAAQLVERLKNVGVRCKEFTFTTSSTNKLARTLYTCLRDRAITLPLD
jgi:hypothetical protein